MRSILPPLLSFHSGYIDTAGFLALQGLFTAHVTGNFVTLGAAVVFGTAGVAAKLLALPVFCVFVVLVRLLGAVLEKSASDQMRVLLSIKLVLLIGGAALAVSLGPFADSDTWPALATGMTFVSAMAIQNAFQRIHLANSPPTTIMTGNTTQIMIDLVDVLRPLPEAQKAPVRARLKRFVATALAFAAGCAIAAALFAVSGRWCFILPPILGFVALLLHVTAPPPAVAKAL